jgi:predicted phosphodiesterase
MRVAALYDIHGNLPALEGVLDEVRRTAVDAIVVGGDVLPGPMPRQCLELLASTGIPTEFIHGNGESAAIDALKGGAIESVPEAFRPWVQWSAAQLPDELADALPSWPATTSLDVDGVGHTLFCHATPRNDTEIFTKLSPERYVEDRFAGVTARIAVCGHTHMQFDRTIGSLRIVNAGSVGMPFGEPGAYWLLLGPDVQLRHTRFDFDAAATRVRATSYPGAEAFAKQILQPFSEQVTLDSYARVDGRETRVEKRVGSTE